MKFEKILNEESSPLKGLTRQKFLDAWDTSNQKKKFVKEWGHDINRKKTSINSVNDTGGNDIYVLGTELEPVYMGTGEKEHVDVYIEFFYKDGVLKIRNCRAEE